MSRGALIYTPIFFVLPVLPTHEDWAFFVVTPRFFSLLVIWTTALLLLLCEPFLLSPLPLLVCCGDKTDKRRWGKGEGGGGGEERGFKAKDRGKLSSSFGGLRNRVCGRSCREERHIYCYFVCLRRCVQHLKKKITKTVNGLTTRTRSEGRVCLCFSGGGGGERRLFNPC